MPFLIIVIIADGSPWNTHILLVEDEEISTFWHDHRNRCFIFLCEMRWKQKRTFSKVLLLFYEYIWLQSTKSQNWKKNKKRNVGWNFEKKRRLFAEWRDNAWIIALFVFFSKFLTFFCFRLFVEFFFFDDYYVIYWKTNTITLQNLTFLFFNSSHEKIK